MCQHTRLDLLKGFVCCVCLATESGHCCLLCPEMSARYLGVGAAWGGVGWGASGCVYTSLFPCFLSFPSFSFLLSFSFLFFLSCQGPVMEPRLALHLQFPSMPGSHISSMDFQVTEEEPCLVVVDTLLSVWILMLLSSEMGFTRAHWYS